MIHVTDMDAEPYYKMYMMEYNKLNRTIEWARKMVRGREEFVMMQLARLKGALWAHRDGACPQPPGLAPEGIAGLILFKAGDPEVVVQGLSREDIIISPGEGKLIIRVAGGKQWVYSFSPPGDSAPTAEASPEASVLGARARIKKRAR